MSVLACDRAGCDNIMCDRTGVGIMRLYYICDDCFEELVRIGPTVDITAFMDGETAGAAGLEASRAYFETVFSNQQRITKMGRGVMSKCSVSRWATLVLLSAAVGKEEAKKIEKKIPQYLTNFTVELNDHQLKIIGS